ncbi:MAG: phosphoenolpyruvate--protein phosphotransferase [Deltaproteobacteria bacterium]|jgi:phosphoenolpyruvate-protein phosphotransferase (PTS system enzyme I)|nr:phosphoenolpyruvate--protein phosphotransferase [Deltaproteobacteria bacterium]
MKARRFRSNATSPGIAIGTAYHLQSQGAAFVRYWIGNSDVKEEIDRLKNSLQKSKEQLDQISAKMCRFQGHDQIKIIESHRMFLQDDMLVSTTIQHIQESKINAEWALDKTLAHLKLSFLNVDEEYFRERQQDIDYVGRRIMDNLMGTPALSLSDLPKGEMILIVHDLSPAEVANLPKDRVKGFIMEGGGETSHTAIISRALEIPAVFSLKGIFDSITDGETIILDGMKGLIVASPTKKEKEQYITVQENYAALERILMQDIHLPAETKDGYRISIEGNMELLEEIPSLIDHGAEGIGLYRTEYLFLDRLDEPTEDEQFDNYTEVLERLSPKPVTIRTIDLGGDKMPLSHAYDLQTNPALGLRGIRLCLKERPLFKTQLRAILRASVHGHPRILIPMISSVDEIRTVKKIIGEIKEELTEQNIKFKSDIPLGIMIEVPSAVFLAPELAMEVDFFSIGTNDLIQYGLAIDRINEHVAEMYNPFHPAVLRMIKSTVDAAKKAGIKISLCGELAGDPLAITLMVGMELDSLSMNPVSIPKVKKVLRSITKVQTEKLTEYVLTLKTADDIVKYIKKQTKHILPGDIKKLHIVDGQI